MSDEQTPTTGAETTASTEAQGTPANQERGNPNPPTTPEDKKKVKWLGVALILIPLFIIFSLVLLWPTDATEAKTDAPIPKNTVTTSAGTPADTPTAPDADNGKTPVEGASVISFQLRMLLLVLLGGALGSYIQMATSFSHYIGIDRFDMNWFWWYLLRIPIGAVLALIFSMLIQGGMLTVPSGGAANRHVAIIGLAALIGMFSRQATEKLQEIFDTFFKSKVGMENKERQDNFNKNPQQGGQAAGTKKP